jgi:hypothetical protein
VVVLKILLILLTCGVLYSQDIQVVHNDRGYCFVITNLPDEIITFRIFQGDRCISGGEMDAIDYLDPTYITKDRGKFIIELRIRNKIIYRKDFEIS